MRLSGKLALVLVVAIAGLGIWWAARPKEEPSLPAKDSAPKPIAGCVRNARGPVAAARVRVKGTTIAGSSDPEGRFQLVPGDKATSSVTAWKPGYLIAGVTAGSTPLDLLLAPLPARDNEGYRWVDPAPDPQQSGNCANCHAEIYREWAASGHSRSATGRRFRNLYEGTNWKGETHNGWGLLTQYPDGAGVCASCHAPAIREEESAARDDLRLLTGVARQGVHCDYCHKIADVGDGDLGRTHGRFNLQLLRPAEGKQLFFGPLDDVDRGEDAYSPLYHESRYCASCHEGVVFGVRVYSTYTEWLASPARRQGKQCQDCHMTPTGTMTNFAPGHGGIERNAKTLGNHRFFAPGHEEMLRRAVRVVTESTGTRVTVRVTAEDVGHRVPTGFIDRHLLLIVEALDARGGRVAAVGPKLPTAAGPEFENQAGRLFGRVLTGRDGKTPAPFWFAAGEPVDTRLIPAQPVATTWELEQGAVQLRVRLVYRRFWAETARSKGWPDADTVIHDQTKMLK